MTPRLRILAAAAIFFALAWHPFAHPLLKECPCVLHVATAAVEQNSSFVLCPLADRLVPCVEHAAEAPAISGRSSRAPPAA